MRILGLDVGDKRIGVAVSDGLGLTAQGLTTIVRSDIKKDIERLAAIIREHSIEKIIVGLPRNMNGTYGPQAEKTKEFVKLLRKEIPLEVVFWDERLTTALARRTLLEGDVSRKKRREVIDRMAAVVILQGFLDRGGSKG
ncbi:MAG: Holliday junction resolvase RuvX [Peptococcaceae bacterium]|jgi:putative Holliday junction resolvase|nr:Holliday junction resolvase RuvX [Peptococcaceae bacterium]MDH7525150.1 Holliday junction resolvase RuvX [Peptococcaceae bacterium]